MKLKPRVRSLSNALVFGLFGKGTGFLVPVIIAANFGVSRDSDSFFLAFAVSSVLLPIWSQSAQQFAVPLFAEVAGATRIEGRMRWIRSRALLGAVITATLGGIALYAYLCIWSGHDFRRSTMINYMLLVPQVLAGARSSTYSAFLISRDEHRWPAGSIALRAVGVLLMISVCSSKLGLASVAAGYSVGEMARLFALRWLALRKMHAATAGDVGDAAPAQGTLCRGIHHMGSMATIGIGQLVERSLAATLGVGIVTRLEYASKLYYVPAALFDLNLSAVFLSAWSRLAAQREWTSFDRDVRATLRRIFAASAGIAVIAILCRGWLVQLALVRGSFPLSEAVAVANVLGILLVAIPFSATAMLAAAAYVAVGENRLILRVSVLKMTVRSTGSLILGHWFGLEGIAWAFVLTHVLELIAFYLPFARVVGRHSISVSAPMPLSPSA